MSKITNKLSRLNRIRKKDWSQIKRELKWLAARYRERRSYQIWIKSNLITENRRREILEQIERLKHKPKISVILPVYEISERLLRLCIESVSNQIYENWELCIADDFSPSAHVRKILERYAAEDTRIKVVFREKNGHISAASNSALELATGEFTVLLDHDDELAEDALFWVAKEINDFPETKMIYSDEDLISVRGRRFEPKFKPDFSRDLFYSLNLITHLSAYKTDILRKIGGFTVGLEGSQDYDLALRVIERIPEKHLRHIPKILYHWRVMKGSVALSGDEKPYAHEAARRAIRAHFERTGKNASVEKDLINLHRVSYKLPADPPKVSLILLSDEDPEFTMRSVENLRNETGYANFEIVLVCPETLKEAVFSKEIKTIFSAATNEAERYNLAAAESTGEILCFIDINLRPLSKDWLREMAGFAVQKETGATGAKLLYKNESILHGGLIIGVNDSVGIAHHKLPQGKSGNMLRTQVIGNFSAVSVSCLAARREVFENAGGFDAQNFPNKFFDVDFCLKLLEKNFRNVFTPYAELMQIDERKLLNVQKKPDEKELENFRRKWRKFIERDPFYNPNLSKKSEDFSIDV